MPDRHRSDEANGGVGSAPALPEVYDPGYLLGDVMRLLAVRGLSCAVSTAGLRAAVDACEDLLRCLGVTPVRRTRLTALTDPANVDLRVVERAHFLTTAWSGAEVREQLAQVAGITVTVTREGLPDGQVEVRISGDRANVKAAADALDVDYEDIEPDGDTCE
jgi:hypothetical protein